MAEAIGWIVAATIFIMIFVWLMRRGGRERLHRTEVGRAVMRPGLTPVTDLPAVTRRVSALLEPLEPSGPERAFSFRVGGHDAFLYEWRPFGSGREVAGVPGERMRSPSRSCEEKKEVEGVGQGPGERGPHWLFLGSRAVLLYVVGFHLFVRFHEEPGLRRRFGAVAGPLGARADVIAY